MLYFAYFLFQGKNCIERTFYGFTKHQLIFIEHKFILQFLYFWNLDFSASSCYKGCVYAWIMQAHHYYYWSQNGHIN